MGPSARRLPAFAASLLASQLGSATEAINFLHWDAFLHGYLRVGERRPERTTGCMNASLIRNCGSGTPDFSTIQGATGGTAVGMTSNRGTKSLKCCAESGQAKMAGHSIVCADVMTQAGSSILHFGSSSQTPEMYNCSLHSCSCSDRPKLGRLQYCR